MKDAMIAGRLDAFWFQITAMPASVVVDLSTARKIRFVDISDDIVDRFYKKYGKYCVRFVIPPKTYDFQDKPVLGFANFSMFITYQDLDPDLAYKVTKVVYEKQKEMAKVYPAFAEWTFEGTIDEVIPLHDGARKFYKEKGIIK